MKKSNMAGKYTKKEIITEGLSAFGMAFGLWLLINIMVIIGN